MQLPIFIYPSPDLPVIQNMVTASSICADNGVMALHLAKAKGFCVYGEEKDEDVLVKVKLMMEGLDKPTPQYACCGLAVPRHCVCIASFECPIHGDNCTGGHD